MSPIFPVAEPFALPAVLGVAEDQLVQMTESASTEGGIARTVAIATSAHESFFSWSCPHGHLSCLRLLPTAAKAFNRGRMVYAMKFNRMRCRAVAFASGLQYLSKRYRLDFEGPGNCFLGSPEKSAA